MTKKTLNQLAALLLCCTAPILASCGDDDDTGKSKVTCDICSYEVLNSQCTIAGESYHCGTTYAQVMSNNKGTNLILQVHKDGGSVNIYDYRNIRLWISPASGPSLDDMTKGQTLDFTDGTDQISLYYNASMSSAVQTTYNKYVSGTVSCTAKSGTTTILTFKDVVLQHTSDGTKITINGTFVCDQYR